MSECKHSYAMLYTQYKTNDEVHENRLRFHCFVCGGAERTISAKFLKRQARYNRATYVLRWVDIQKYWQVIIKAMGGVNYEAHRRYQLFLTELDKHIIIDDALKIALETKLEDLPEVIFEE